MATLLSRQKATARLKCSCHYATCPEYKGTGKCDCSSQQRSKGAKIGRTSAGSQMAKSTQRSLQHLFAARGQARHLYFHQDGRSPSIRKDPSFPASIGALRGEMQSYFEAGPLQHLFGNCRMRTAKVAAAQATGAAAAAAAAARAAAPCATTATDAAVAVGSAGAGATGAGMAGADAVGAGTGAHAAAAGAAATGAGAAVTDTAAGTGAGARTAAAGANADTAATGGPESRRHRKHRGGARGGPGGGSGTEPEPRRLRQRRQQDGGGVAAGEEGSRYKKRRPFGRRGGATQKRPRAPRAAKQKRPAGDAAGSSGAEGATGGGGADGGGVAELTAGESGFGDGTGVPRLPPQLQDAQRLLATGKPEDRARAEQLAMEAVMSGGGVEGGGADGGGTDGSVADGGGADGGGGNGSDGDGGGGGGGGGDGGGEGDHTAIPPLPAPFYCDHSAAWSSKGGHCVTCPLQQKLMKLVLAKCIWAAGKDSMWNELVGLMDNNAVESNCGMQ